jgi:hypothetical protein
MEAILPWILSVLGISRKYLLGEKNRWGWLVGLVTQLLWLVYIKETQAWGFLLLSAVGIYLNIHNFIKWS